MYRGKNPHRCPVTSKRCYTKKAAQAAARSLGGRTVTNKRVSAYRCPHANTHPDGAGLFHIGHTPRRRRRR